MAERNALASREPVDPLSAVTHPDPYPYYARLVAERPLHFDERLGIWVASSAVAVTAVLASPACRVRPAAEPVPKLLLGSVAGEIFGCLARMTDGPAHVAARAGASALLAALDVERLARECDRQADRLCQDLDPSRGGEPLQAFASALPVRVVASLLGVADEALDAVASEVGALVRCLFPGGSEAEIEAGKRAAVSLLPRFRKVARGDDAMPAVANAIGLLAQSHDATAGLVCTTLLTLAREGALREGVRREPERLRAVVSEVLRFDAPIQNTRRFVAEPVTIDGRALRPGDSVLVVLAAANRDPRANPSPEVLDPAREAPATFSFGVGPHACAGRELAQAIAGAGVARLLALGLEPRRLGTSPSYRPSPNARIPLLGVVAHGPA